MAVEELKDLKHTLTEWLKQNNADPHQMADYEKLWLIAIYDQSAPIPCPRCYSHGGIVARLKAR
jgi:hypothetical protein